ncbi:TonB-dependent receptor plug domain-containing protein [Chitinophaga defluvii]|uniref:TonB-dependent receptor plug domain-containing protein n=1 Tax=Chitinophaga defluvii TaxID=3163343 RepID=A0ABV2T1C0_9BACT
MVITASILRRAFALLPLLAFSLSAIACDWKIRVVDENMVPVRNASVLVNTPKTQAVTDKNGIAIFKNIPPAQYHLTITALQFETKQYTLHFNCEKDSTYTIYLYSRQLKAVTVTSQTAVKKLQASSFTVEAIDVSAVHGQSSDVIGLLNRAPGIRLRTDGNIGSQVNINLNGLQGEAIRMFKDGIPLDIFGHGFDPGLIPSNLLSRIEVYKGVMPVSLGADALGGGINFVTAHPKKSLLDVSYEYGSFNTHRTSITGYLGNDSTKRYAGINASHTYTDNSYYVTAPVFNAETGQQVPTRVKRFHDGANAFYGEFYLGWKRLPWADDIRLTLIGSSFYKAIQHDARMHQVYGQAFGEDLGVTSMFRYQKALLQQRLHLDAALIYSFFDTRFVDTATTRYNWDGSILNRRMPKGEINTGNDQQLNYHFYSVRANAGYKINEQHSLQLNQVLTRRQRKGTDPLGALSHTDGVTDVLTIPAIYSKSVTGLNFRSFFAQHKIENNVAVKYYRLYTTGYTTDNFGVSVNGKMNTSSWGALDAISYQFHNNWLAKASYEYAVRLPSEYEVFGDAQLVKENMQLQPEKSHNVNLQVQYSDAGPWQVQTNLFLRHVKNLIFIEPDIPFSRYTNYDNAKVKGIEFDVLYTPFKLLTLGLNGTYQDIRRVDIPDPSLQYLERSRVPNIPFLFGNASARFHYKQLEVYYYINYVHRFFLLPIPRDLEPPLFGKPEKISTTSIIPNDNRTGQWEHAAGAVYRLLNRRISISAECRNIGDVNLYDNFKVQRPGRNFHVKLGWQLQQ